MTFPTTRAAAVSDMQLWKLMCLRPGARQARLRRPTPLESRNRKQHSICCERFLLSVAKRWLLWLGSGSMLAEATVPGGPAFDAMRRFTMSRFVTHESIANGFLNLEFCGASGSVSSWGDVLTNSCEVLDLMIRRMEADYLGSHPKSRRAWSSRDLDGPSWSRPCEYRCLQYQVIPHIHDENVARLVPGRSPCSASARLSPTA